jgi:hypothetical protein
LKAVKEIRIIFFENLCNGEVWPSFMRHVLKPSGFPGAVDGQIKTNRYQHHTTDLNMKKIITLLSVLAMAATVSAADGDAKKKGEGKAKGKGDPAAAFKKMDKDGDGKVTKEEYMATPQAKKDAAKAGESFTKRDKNSDGSLSMEEFAPAKKGKK